MSAIALTLGYGLGNLLVLGHRTYNYGLGVVVMLPQTIFAAIAPKVPGEKCAWANAATPSTDYIVGNTLGATKKFNVYMIILILCSLALLGFAARFRSRLLGALTAVAAFAIVLSIALKTSIIEGLTGNNGGSC